MDVIQRGLRTLVLVLLAVATVVPAAAAEIVAFDASPSGLTWRPLVTFEHCILTVSTPDGLVFSQEFKGAGGISFNPVGQANYQAPDGTYIWQVTLGQPSKVDARLRAAAAAARAGDGDPDVEAAHRAASARSTLIQSGAFQIQNGAIVPSNLVEPGTRSRGAGPRSMTTDAFRKVDWLYDDPAVRQVDQVIPDDLIVQGSLCVGLDCVNNESFGFDTIRLKENNTRIKFDDTSTSAGFPANDWQLTANDSASGGSSKFSIEDITGSKVPFTITAGAATNSIFVDSTGRLGLRTSTPVLDVHVNTSNTPAIRLEQNGSGGFTAQTWDIAGNEANFFVRDVTGGSHLPFRIRPGAPTSSIDISASGQVGVGTASPSAKLHVFDNTNGATNVLVQNTNAGTGAFTQSIVQADVSSADMRSHAAARTITRWGQTLGGWSEVIHTAGNGLAVGTNTATPLILGTNAANRIQISSTGGITLANFTSCAGGLTTNASGALQCNVSSQEFKNIAGELQPQVALANVMALRPHTGSYKETPDIAEHWLIAEQAAAVDPALVGFKEGKPYAIKTQNVVADLIAVVQQQQRRIEEQQRFIEQQQSRLEALERAASR
jgi:hypothetical protein